MGRMLHLGPEDIGFEVKEYSQLLLQFNPRNLDEDLRYVAEAIHTDITFEPFNEVGDAQRLLEAAANLFHFIEEFERRNGGLELPLAT